MRRTLMLLGLLMVLAVPCRTARAQADDRLDAARQAFRAERYEEAARHLEAVTAEEAPPSEAYYLLARIYTETPLRDERRARRALDAAVQLEPDNLIYLVAQLQRLRTESWNFFAERIKEAQRRALAQRILALDATNAFAHEELGAAYLHDFWRYRNAFMLPALQMRRGSIREGNDALVNEYLTQMEAQARGGNAGAAGSGKEAVANIEREVGGLEVASHVPLDPQGVFVGDAFDLEQMRSMGVPVQDLRARARRSYDQAIGHLHQALASDPRRRSVYDLLMRIYALQGAYGEALEMLQQMYVFFDEDPALWTYLGLAHYRQENLEAAAKSFETAFRYMPPETVAAYDRLDDLLPADERAAYQADAVAYAARYWTSKDPRYLTTYNERRLEHYARLTYADLLYSVPELGLRGWETQRGQILVRYGPPTVDVVIVPEGTSYAQRRLLVQVLSDKEISEAAGLDLLPEMNTFNVWDYGDFQFVFEDPMRNGRYRLYSPSAAEIGAGLDGWQHDYVIKAEETFRTIPDRYAYTAPGRQVELPYLVNAFKGADGQADLYVHYGVPIHTYDASQPMIEVTANVGTFLVGPERNLLMERRRTIYGLRTAQIIPFAETNLWVDTQQMQAPPGPHQLSVEFETASGATVAVQRGDVDVPAFGTELALSDVLLAYNVAETADGQALGAADIVRHGLSITPAPWSVYAHERPVYLYFEAYNLTQRAEGPTDYEVEIRLVPKEKGGGLGRVFKRWFGGDEQSVAARYSAAGTVADEVQYQILDVTDYPPGLYTLTVRLQDRISGQTVAREEELFLE